MIGRNLFLGTILLASLPAGIASASASGGEEGGGGGGLIDMDPISVPIVDGSRLEGTLHFRLVLEAADSSAADSLQRNLPLLRADALAAGAEFSRVAASPLLVVDAQRLAADLTEALHARDQGLARVLLVEVAAKSY